LDLGLEGVGLGGKIPSEAAGIEVKGENKWVTTIQYASKALPQPNNQLEG
jgi:hypothetical protein